MRRLRNFDAELKALNEKAKLLKDRKVMQIGELVIACGADALPIEQLAGALLLAVEEKNAATREAQRTRGAAFFQQSPRRAADRTARAPGGEPASARGAEPAASGARPS